MKVGRRESFNAAHRLYLPEWSDEKNQEVFGKCSNPNFHGHNYILETWIDGEIDPVTGFVIDMEVLKAIIKNEVLERFDHRNLNLDCEEFKNLIPTAENILMVIYKLIRPKLDAKYKLTLKMWETEKNIFEYSDPK
jgi:6-pyruvoyltetrahydropterin/6-carboxytetrahydropterin synthase